MLAELRKVIPAFLARVDVPERGGRWTQYLTETREDLEGRIEAPWQRANREPRAEVTLTDFDPDGEIKVVAAALYAGIRLPRRSSCSTLARRMTPDGAGRGAARGQSASARTGGTAPAARSSARPIASTCSPTTAHSGIYSGTGS